MIADVLIVSVHSLKALRFSAHCLVVIVSQGQPGIALHDNRMPAHVHRSLLFNKCSVSQLKRLCSWRVPHALLGLCPPDATDNSLQNSVHQQGTLSNNITPSATMSDTTLAPSRTSRGLTSRATFTPGKNNSPCTYATRYRYHSCHAAPSLLVGYAYAPPAATSFQPNTTSFTTSNPTPLHCTSHNTRSCKALCLHPLAGATRQSRLQHKRLALRVTCG